MDSSNERVQKRIEKEIEELGQKQADSCKLYELLTNGKDELGNIILKVKLIGEEDSIYKGESWVLQLVLKNYPFEAPTTTFVGTPPQHIHIYSNGHICLSLLYEDWIPSISLSTLILEIMRMLAASTSKSPPPDDFQYCVSHQYGSDPKLTKFSFHTTL